MKTFLEALLQSPPLRRFFARRTGGEQIVLKLARPKDRRRGLALVRVRRRP